MKARGLCDVKTFPEESPGILRRIFQAAPTAQHRNIPVLETTAAGKGTFAETHPLALGVFGTFGTPAANACLGEADLVVVVGSKLSPSG